MMWDGYVFRRGIASEELWDQMFADRRSGGKSVRLLYIAGRGFDVRTNVVVARFVERVKASGCVVEDATLVLVRFSGYQLDKELHDLTRENAETLEKTFKLLGPVSYLEIDGSAEGEDDISTATALRLGAEKTLKYVTNRTDVILDVSSLPRIAYLTILLSLLAKLVPDVTGNALSSGGVTLQVLVGEDANLDSKISSEDPSNDLVLIPGYSEAMQAEALRDLPLVWFPILGENRAPQLKKVEESIPTWAEICPILPHPSRNPRRGDELLVEYDSILFGTRETPLSNILYAHESHPFEAYRQLLGAMRRYRNTMSVMGGCRLVVTPLASKLITIGSALACHEMKLSSSDRKSSVAISYAEPKRYVAKLEELRASIPEVSSLVLTGNAYEIGSDRR